MFAGEEIVLFYYIIFINYNNIPAAFLSDRKARQ